MNTLDRYIARQYLFNIAALLVVLFSFVVAVDVALNIDRFLDSATRLDPQASGFRKLILVAIGALDLWWPRLLQLFNYLIGIILVAAMGFTFTQLVRQRELVAILAGGISLHRIARPILVVACGVMLLKVVNTEFILSSPRIAPLLSRDQGDVGKRSWAEFPVRLVRDGSGRIFLAEKFDPTGGRLEGLTIWERDSTGNAQRAIQAQSATWNDEAGAWVLSSAKVVPLVLTASGSPDLGFSGSAPAQIKTDLNPETLKLKRFEAFRQSLSWSQISELIRTAQPDVRDDLQRTRWSRVSQTICALLTLVITMPFFLTREPRNMLVQSLKCAPAGIGSMVGSVLLSTMAWPVLPAGFAVFIPVLILIPVAIASVSWLKT